MRPLVLALALPTAFAAACSSDLVLPDEVTPGTVAGASGTDWWLGMPGPAAGDAVLDARLTRYVDGAFVTLDTIDVCQGACGHIAHGGRGLLALDHPDGVLLIDAAGVIAAALPHPDDTVDAPWLLAGRADTLVAASGTRAFARDGDAWRELPALDAPAFSIDVQDNGVIVARRALGERLEHAALVDDAWVAAEGTSEDALVHFASDGSFVDDAALTVDGEVARLALLEQGLLAARVLNGALDVVLVPAGGAPAVWAALGGVDGTPSAASFRAAVFEDGTVGVLYPGGPRESGVGPKAVLHVGAL